MYWHPRFDGYGFVAVRFFLALFLCLFAFSAFAQHELPRYASTKSDEVNVRTGPGLRYPIRTVLIQKNLPLEVTAEFEQWRKIRDSENAEGWVHQSVLSRQRFVMIKEKIAILYRKPEVESRKIARLAKNVSAELLECNPGWCRVKVEGAKGWVEKKSLWGVGSSEIIED